MAFAHASLVRTAFLCECHQGIAPISGWRWTIMTAADAGTIVACSNTTTTTGWARNRLIWRQIHFVNDANFVNVSILWEMVKNRSLSNLKRMHRISSLHYHCIEWFTLFHSQFKCNGYSLQSSRNEQSINYFVVTALFTVSSSASTRMVRIGVPSFSYTISLLRSVAKLASNCSFLLGIFDYSTKRQSDMYDESSAFVLICVCFSRSQTIFE